MDLKQLEDDLNRDQNLRESFIRSPVETLKQRGLLLPARAEQSLAQLVREVSSANNPAAGSTLSSVHEGKDVEIRINISKDF